MIHLTVQELFLWLNSQEALVNHIKGGAARDLYPQKVASVTEQLTEQLSLQAVAQLEEQNG